MSTHTNNTIHLWSEERDWQGELATVDLGPFDVYLEEHETKEVFSNPYDEGSHSDALQASSKGFFILYEDKNLTKKIISYDDKTYTIAKWDRYTDMKSKFHHIEATYI